jgi:hypothetical protein
MLPSNVDSLMAFRRGRTTGKCRSFQIRLRNRVIMPPSLSLPVDYIASLRPKKEARHALPCEFILPKSLPAVKTQYRVVATAQYSSCSPTSESGVDVAPVRAKSIAWLDKSFLCLVLLLHSASSIPVHSTSTMPFA